MPDSSAVDNAVIAKLGADAQLLAICLNGVFWDEAPPGSQRFVIVSLVEEHDEPQFGGRAFETATYQVKAVALSTTGADIKAAAARIDALLEHQALTVAGYDHLAMHRTARIRMTEVDDQDASIRWQHRGGHYQVVVAQT